MNQFLHWLSELVNSWKFWLVVPPWDVAVRIRLGRTAVALAPGLHWRIPLVDEVIIVNTRSRMTTIMPVTVSAASCKTRTITAVVGYRVTDPLRSLMAFENPQLLLVAMAAAEIALHQNAETAQKALDARLSPRGVSVEFVQFIEDVQARTLRVLTGNSGTMGTYEGGAPGAPRH